MYTYNIVLFIVVTFIFKGYFDEIIAPEDIVDDKRESSGCKLPQPNEIVKLQINEKYPIGEKEVSSIVEYMDKVVRPYLAKRNHLNADIWLKVC